MFRPNALTIKASENASTDTKVFLFNLTISGKAEVGYMWDAGTIWVHKDHEDDVWPYILDKEVEVIRNMPRGYVFQADNGTIEGKDGKMYKRLDIATIREYNKSKHGDVVKYTQIAKPEVGEGDSEV